MRDELYPYYERELTFIRQMAADFGAKYPRAAGRLKLEKDRESADPHVERLIQSFALIAGRISQKIDDEFPEITEALLNVLYPHYLRPVPSMSIAQFELDPDHSTVTGALPVDAGTVLYSRPVNGTTCQFRTCYPVILWPLQITSAGVGRSSTLSVAGAEGAIAAIRITLQCTGGATFSKLPLASLRFFLSGEPRITNALYELIFNNGYHAFVRDPKRRPNLSVQLREPFVRQVGFERDEAILPYPRRSFAAYRFLQEYFAFPSKFLFFDLDGLERLAHEGFDDRAEIVILLNEFERKERLPQIEQAVSRDTFRLGCTPIVNLFDRCAEPIRVSHARTEYRVIADEHDQAGTEVFSVNRAVAVKPSTEETIEYEPFYSFRHRRAANGGNAFWFAHRRPSHRKEGGTEVYLSLVDLDFRPSWPASDTLTAWVTCTNRNRASELPYSGAWGELDVESAASVRVRMLRKPTESIRPPLRRGLQWRLISHLGLNYLSIVEDGLPALQEILRLYDFSDSDAGAEAIQHQIDGILRVSGGQRSACLASDKGIVFCTGIGVDIVFDEQQLAASEAFLFASVLERFFALYSSINSFSQLTAYSQQRKRELKRWPPRAGEQILL